MLEYAERS
jgi:hypothetical protein